MILFIVFLLPFYLYLSYRLSTHWSHWLVIGSLFITILSFPFKKYFRYQLHLIYAGMGLLTFLLVFTLLRDLVWLATGTLYSVNYVILFTVLSLLVGFANAFRGPQIKKIYVKVDNLPSDLEGFKIAQISDLHVGATIRKPYVEKVVRRVNELKADMVALTGDIGDGVVKHYRGDIAPMSKLKSTYGTFFTPGNHEYYWNVNEWLSVMNNLGIINLVNRGKVIHHHNATILVGGIPDPVGGIAPDLLGIQDSASGETASFRILLSHRPGIAPEAHKNGFDLLLSGHTHGGQFFPWTLVVKAVHRYSEGLHRLGDMWIYVNQGTGSWGPLIRLGTTPEITLLMLTQSKSEHKLISG